MKRGTPSFAAMGIEVSSVSIFRLNKQKQATLAATLGVAVEFGAALHVRQWC